jgi:cell division protein FtsI/penicillin-binding protein 2
VLNKNISDSFEPGSVIKPMTIATAIDLGLINDKSIFYDNGPISYSGKNIDNWDHKHLGALDPTLILQKSNNVATAQVGILIGEENLRKYFQNFGFGKKTGIDMEGEENGILRSTKWEDIDIANISFGQGVSATPLQVLTSFNVFANDGKFLRPRIILEIKKSNGERVEYPVSETNQIISNSTNQMMNQILVNSTKYNEGKYFLLKNYDISGKTGTGQIFREGKYLEDKTNASFVGFLTRSKKFSMFVRLEEPSSSTYASETAMPVWMSIATELINIFNLPPDY